MLAKSALLVIIASIFTKLLGFLRDIVMASKLGVTSDADIYLLSQVIVGVVISISTLALKATFIPIFSKYLGHITLEKKFLNTVYTLGVLLQILFACIGIALSPIIIEYIAPGFHSDKKDIAILLTQYSFIVLPFSIIGALNNNFLQAKKRYTLPTLSGLPLNFVMISYMVFFHSILGIKGLVFATVFSTIAQVIFQAPFLKSSNFKFSFDFHFKQDWIKKMSALMIPTAIGASALQIELIVSRSLASNLAEGSIAALSFANRLTMFVTSIFITGIITVTYPQMAKFASESKVQDLKALLEKLLNITALIVFPILTLFIILRYPILKLVFERGAFNSDATKMTATALLYYSFGLIWIALQEVLNSAFYSIQNTKLPMYNILLSACVSIAFSFYLVRYGITGLAISNSIGAMAGGIMLLIALKKYAGFSFSKNNLIVVTKVLISSLVMGCISFNLEQIFLNQYKNPTTVINFFRLLINSSISISIFLLLIKVFNIYEGQLAHKLVKQKMQSFFSSKK